MNEGEEAVMKSSYSVNFLRGMVVFDMVVLERGRGHHQYPQPVTTDCYQADCYRCLLL